MAKIATCAAGGAERVDLDGLGEMATMQCVTTKGANTGSQVSATLATAPAAKPRIIVRNASEKIRARLATGRTATVGSPITADPANTEPVEVELVDPFDVPYGALELDAAESIEVDVTPQNTVQMTVLAGTITLTIAGQTATLSSGQTQTFGTLAIDIKPEDSPNSINPRSGGKIPVAVLSHTTLDAPTQLDRTSLTFGRTGDEPSLAFCDEDEREDKDDGDDDNDDEDDGNDFEDVNGDGLPDLICYFHTQTAGFQPGDTQGFLKARTLSGVPLTGLDAVRIVPPEKDGGKSGKKK